MLGMKEQKLAWFWPHATKAVKSHHSPLSFCVLQTRQIFRRDSDLYWQPVTWGVKVIVCDIVFHLYMEQHHCAACVFVMFFLTWLKCETVAQQLFPLVRTASLLQWPRFNSVHRLFFCRQLSSYFLANEVLKSPPKKVIRNQNVQENIHRAFNKLVEIVRVKTEPFCLVASFHRLHLFSICDPLNIMAIKER